MNNLFAVYKAIYGDSHPHVATSLSNIAQLYEAREQYEQALEYFQQCLTMQLAFYEDNHPRVLQTTESIEDLMQTTQDNQQ